MCNTATTECKTGHFRLGLHSAVGFWSMQLVLSIKRIVPVVQEVGDVIGSCVQLLALRYTGSIHCDIYNVYRINE